MAVTVPQIRAAGVGYCTHCRKKKGTIEQEIPMHPAVRALGTLLRLVGISSPEDTAPRPSAIGQEPARQPASPSAFPPLRSPSPTPNPPASTSPLTPPKDNPPSV